MSCCRLPALLAALALSVFAAGCATNRSELRLPSPGAAAPAAPGPGAPVAVIRRVTDQRQFEQAPSHPATPSLGFEGAARATAEAKLRAIGRKRNTFGQALGDVFLQDGQTVETVVRDSVAAVLQGAGYQVQDAAAAAAPALAVEVQVRQFWAWVRPGFWAVTLSADIATDLQFTGAAAPVPVQVHVEDARQLVTDAAWLDIVGQALQAYQAELALKLPPRP